MATGSSAKSVDVLLRDDGELPELSEALPRKWGLPPSPVQLQCLTSSKDVLVIGTNHSMIVVYNLRSQVTDKISLEGSLKRSGVTALDMVPEVFNRTAIGRQNGLINIYQLADVEEHKRRSIVKKLHATAVTCVAWDTRGSLLFSADDSGKVYATEVDMREGKHHSWLIYECSSPIVQLSYTSMMLLVSSTSSSVLCNIARDITQTNPTKIGSKDRKVGEYGGCFSLAAKDSDTSILVYVTRPGLRVWRADCQGKVLATLKFKDLFEAGSIPIIKISGRKRDSASSSSGGENNQLGRLLVACGQYLLAWHSDSLWLLEPETGRLVGHASGLGQVLDVCVYKRWVVLLREPPYARQSPIVRLAFDASIVPAGNSPLIAPRFRNVADSPAISKALENLPGLPPARSAATADTAAVTAASADLNETHDTSTRSAVEAEQQHDAPAMSASQQSSETQSPPAAGSSVHEVDDVNDTLTEEARRGPAIDDAAAENTDGNKCPSPVLAARAVSPPVTMTSASPHSPTSSPLLADDESTVARPGQLDDTPTESAGLCTSAPALTRRQPQSSTSNETTEVVHPQQPIAQSVPSVAQKSPSLRHAADSRVPFVPPQFDIAMDEGDMTVVVRPKTKRKGKKGRKDSSQNLVTANQDAAGSSPPTLPRTAVDGGAADANDSDDGEVVVSQDAPRPSVESSAADSVAEQADTAAGVGAADLPSVAEESTSHQVEAMPEEVQSPAVPPDGLEGESLLADEDDQERTSVVSGTTEGLTASDNAGDNAVEVTDNSSQPTANMPGAAITVPDGIQEESAALAELDDQVPTDLIRLGQRPDSLGSPPVVLGKKSSSTAVLSSAEQEEEEEEEDAFAIAKSAAASAAVSRSSKGLEDSGASSGANSVSDSGEHIVSIYDMGPAGPDDDEEGDDSGSAAATPSGGASREVFVPKEAGKPSDQGSQKTMERSSVSGYDVSLTDSWVQCPSPGRHPVQLIMCTPTHVWAVDNKDYVHVWSLNRRRWVTLKGSMRHVAASPSGDIVWGYSKSGSLYHRVGVDRRVRVGSEWRKMDMKVKCIALDNKRAWVLTSSGEVKLRRDVSLAVPTGQQWDTVPDVPNNIRYLAAGGGILWAITTHNVVLARVDISHHKPLGTGWEMVCPGHHFLDVAIGINNTAWFVNMDGVVCFMKKVTLSSPLGDGQLWLSSLGQFVVHDASLLEALWTWSLVKQSDPLRCVSASGSCIAVLNAGSSILHSGGSMTGTWYKSAAPPGIAPSMTWVSVSASRVHGTDGQVWLLQRSGEVFCWKDGERPTVVEAPGRHQLTQISTSLCSIWAVSSEGLILERKDVSDYCPTGTAWQVVPTSVMKGAKIRHVSCGMHSSWAVDDKGQAWLKLSEMSQKAIGASSQWQAVDGPSTAKLVQVVVGPGGWHVWAIDAAGCTYARLDVGIDTPVGVGWQAVGGVNASKLCISNSRVWVCCANGDLVWRTSVTPRNPTGDYWRRIPGTFSDISVTPDDVLWLIDPQGFLFRRETCVYEGSRPSKPVASASLDSWVVV